MSDRWIQKAVKRPGAATRKARAAGQSLGEWARSHAHDPNPTTRGQAQFALRARRTHGFRKKTRVSRRGSRR